jgi:hypothetical protein
MVVYGCETWSLALMEGDRLKLLENRVQKMIFGPENGGLIGGCRKLRKEELHNWYFLPSIIRMRWAGHVAQRGGEKYI